MFRILISLQTKNSNKHKHKQLNKRQKKPVVVNWGPICITGGESVSWYLSYKKRAAAWSSLLVSIRLRFLLGIYPKNATIACFKSSSIKKLNFCEICQFLRVIDQFFRVIRKPTYFRIISVFPHQANALHI